MQSINDIIDGSHGTAGGAQQIPAGSALVIGMVAGFVLALWLVAAIYAFTI